MSFGPCDCKVPGDWQTGCWLFSERGHHMWDNLGRCIFCKCRRPK